MSYGPPNVQAAMLVALLPTIREAAAKKWALENEINEMIHLTDPFVEMLGKIEEALAKYPEKKPKDCRILPYEIHTHTLSKEVQEKQKQVERLNARLERLRGYYRRIITKADVDAINQFPALVRAVDFSSYHSIPRHITRYGNEPVQGRISMLLEKRDALHKEVEEARRMAAGERTEHNMTMRKKWATIRPLRRKLEKQRADMKKAQAAFIMKLRTHYKPRMDEIDNEVHAKAYAIYLLHGVHAEELKPKGVEEQG